MKKKKTNKKEFTEDKYAGINKLRGSLKIPLDFDYKKIKDDRFQALWEKYMIVR